MTDYYLLTAQESSLLSADMPAASDITSAFSTVAFQGTDAWIGPSPRITRVASPPDFITTAAWLVGVNGDPTTEAQNLANYIVQLTNALNGISSGWGGVNQLPYNPVTNGPVDWWQSGQAASTQTQNTYQSITSQVLSSVENPVGPGNTTPSIGSQVGGQINGLVTGAITGPGGAPATAAIASATTFLTVGAVVVAGAVLLWFAWPLIATGRAVESAAVSRGGPRRNPSRRRHRRW